MNEVSDTLDVEMNCTSRGEHLPEAERNNRTIGERIRATYHNLPYKAIPRIMLRYISMVSTHQLNLFPAKGGVSAYLSPHVLIMTGRNLDFDKHCQVPFGAYVQANQENLLTNTQAPRTIDAIYLCPMTNKQGGHELMNLQTGMMITRNTIWERPPTDLVIRAVKTMADEQGIKTLKITGRNKIPIYPADWIAGVEYDADTDNEQEHNDEAYPIQALDYNFDEELEDENAYDRIDQDEIDELNDDAYNRVDQEEIDEIMAEPGQGNQDANPVDRRI
jgi:hypothetical protein